MKQKRAKDKQPPAPCVGQRGYTTALVILSGVLLGAVAACLTRPSAWMFAFAPVMGAVATAWVWCVVAQFVLRRQPERLLAKSFVRPMQLALCVPVWAVLTMLMLCLPGAPTEEEELLAAALGALLILAAGIAVPLAALVLTSIALALGLRHMKQTPATETALYREGPFALALILLFGILAACGFGIFYLLT